MDLSHFLAIRGKKLNDQPDDQQLLQSFCVVDCGASGHNIRVEPSLKALPIGKLKLGSHVLVTEQVI